jgi:hypothetical protein
MHRRRAYGRVAVVDEHTEAHGPLLFPATRVLVARVFPLLHRFRFVLQMHVSQIM